MMYSIKVSTADFSTRLKGITYRMPQTQACSTLRSQVNKL
jgi:hypothetical protein